MRTDINVPSVEERLNTIERSLALETMTLRGIALADDICMSHDDRMTALNALSDDLSDALGAFHAVKRALPNDVILSDAPAAGGAR